MNKSEIHPGRDYALRERAGAEFERIRILEHVRRDKWKVKWLEKDAGLVDYVKSSAIVCAWGERKRFARDEQHAAVLRDEATRTWPGAEHPISVAVDEILEASGEQVAVYRGVLDGMPDALERVARRAKYELQPGAGYLDRRGERHLPWRTALEVAKGFAAAEPSTVLLHIEVTERRWEVETREPGGSYLLGLLENYRAGWALVRQWASVDADLARLTKEVDRLRQLIDRTVWELRRPDVDAERVAARLDRAVRGT